MLRSKTLSSSFRYALNGLLLSFKTQRNLRIHFVAAVLVLVAGMLWRLSRTELLILVATISLLVLAEMFNTALETVVDLVTPDYHPLAKVAKDVAAGAVLVATVNAVLVGLLLFLDVEQVRRAWRESPGPAQPVHVFVVGLLIVMLLLVIWKVGGGKGRFLHGGVVSGHTALAFFFGTLAVLVSRHPLVAVLALLLALLVSQSRVDAGIHSLREVIYGALLGITVPLVLYLLLPWLTEVLLGARP